MPGACVRIPEYGIIRRLPKVRLKPFLASPHLDKTNERTLAAAHALNPNRLPQKRFHIGRKLCHQLSDRGRWNGLVYCHLATHPVCNALLEVQARSRIAATSPKFWNPKYLIPSRDSSVASTDFAKITSAFRAAHRSLRPSPM